MGPSLTDILLGVLPMLLLIGAWFFFIRRMSGPQEEQRSLMRRQIEALERMAAALEKRP